MNTPTIIICVVVAAIFIAIVARGIYNKKHHKSSCGCGCDGCSGCNSCHGDS